MLIARAAKDWLLLIDQHWKVTVPCFLGGALLFVGVAAWWPKVYTGTAIVELNPAANWQSDTASERAIEAQAIRQATTLPAWAAIVRRLRLSPETVADGRLFDAAESLASQVSIEQIDDAKHGGPVLRVSYAAGNRELALNVTQAVADNLANPSFPLAFQPASLPKLPDSPPLAQVAPLGSTHARKAGPGSLPNVQPSPNVPHTAHKNRVLPPPGRTPAAELERQLKARVEEGAKLESALNESSATLTGLQQQLAQMDQKAAAVPPIAKNSAPQEHKAIAPAANPQIQNLRQELARNQLALDDLRKRYTEDYPDVAAAKDKAQDLQMDINRLEAIDARSQQSEPPPQPAAPPTAARDESTRNRIVQRRNDAQSLRERLQQALDRNHAQAAQLQSELASIKSSDAAIGSGSRIDSSSKDSQALAPAPPAAPPAMQSIADPRAANPEPADSAPLNPAQALPTPIGPSNVAPAALSLAEGPMVAASPAYFAVPLSWLFGIVFGALTAFAAAWLAELRDPSIRSERTLRNLLPDSASFIGGIPRVRHEAIPE